ncbi:MAG: hypothetical protein U0800_10540 [Isosphaeraceae bacterium]
MVIAKGRNIFPSIPPRASTGRNDSSMMSTEKKIGRPTSRQALATIGRTSPATGPSPNRSRSRCMAFSVTTIDESTSTPIEMAMPASDIALTSTSATPSPRSIPRTANAENAASGRVAAMMNEARRWSSTSRTQSVDVIIASITVPDTVPTTPSIRGSGRRTARPSRPGAGPDRVPGSSA